MTEKAKRPRGRPPKGHGAMGADLSDVRVEADAIEAYELVRTLEDQAARADWIRRALDAEAARVLRRHVRETGERDGRAAELLTLTTRRLRG